MMLNKFSVRIPGASENNGYVQLKDKTQYKINLRNDHDVESSAAVTIDGKLMGVYAIKANSTLSIEHPLNSNGKFTFYKTGTEIADSIGLNVEDENTGLLSVEFLPAKKKEIKLQDIKISDYIRYVPVPYYVPRWQPIWYDYTYYPFNPFRPICTNDNTMYYCSTNLDNSNAKMTLSNNVDMKGSNGIQFNVNNTNSIDKRNVDNFIKTTLSTGGTGLSGISEEEYKEPEKGEDLYDISNRTVINLRLVCNDGELKPQPLQTVFSNPVPPKI